MPDEVLNEELYARDQLFGGMTLAIEEFVNNLDLIDDEDFDS